tara:strand:+ start:6065 stop:6391 length:327 start_codon:yes stop_codon:yes gene_type:complete
MAKRGNEKTIIAVLAVLLGLSMMGVLDFRYGIGPDTSKQALGERAEAEPQLVGSYPGAQLITGDVVSGDPYILTCIQGICQRLVTTGSDYVTYIAVPRQAVYGGNPLE